MSEARSEDQRDGAHSSARSEHAFDDARDLAERMIQRRLRATPPRLAVFRLLLVAPRLVSHAELTEALGGSGIDQSTIFRALNELASVGLARRIAFGDSIWRYEATGAVEIPTPSFRRYFLCVDCDAAFRLPDEPLTGEIRETFGFADEAVFKGRCRDCCELSNG